MKSLTKTNIKFAASRFARVFIAQLAAVFGANGFDPSQFVEWIREPKLFVAMIVSSLMVAISKFLRDEYGIDTKVV